MEWRECVGGHGSASEGVERRGERAVVVVVDVCVCDGGERRGERQWRGEEMRQWVECEWSRDGEWSTGGVERASVGPLGDAHKHKGVERRGESVHDGGECACVCSTCGGGERGGERKRSVEEWIGDGARRVRGVETVRGE